MNDLHQQRILALKSKPSSEFDKELATLLDAENVHTYLSVPDTTRELKILRGAGYSRQSDYLIPPSNPPTPRIIQRTVATPRPKPAFTPHFPLGRVSWYPSYNETEQ